MRHAAAQGRENCHCNALKGKKMINPGDKFKYSPAFLRSIGAGPELARRRGIVTEKMDQLRPGGPFYLRVRWNDAADDSGILSSNIVKIK